MRRKTPALIMVLAASLVAGLASGFSGANAAPVTPAAGEKKAPAVQAEVSTPGKDFTPNEPAVVDTTAVAAKVPTPRPSWPAASTATVQLTQPSALGVLTAATPVRPVGTSPVSVGSVNASRKSVASPTSVRVDVLGQDQSQQLGVNGLALRIGRADGAQTPGRVRLQVNYSSFRYAYGGDWASRLRLVELSCIGGSKCSSRVVPNGVHDSKNSTYSADVEANAAATTFALAAAPSGPNGSYAATPLAAASSWSVGAQTGDFTWSYPMRVPPGTVGPKPDLSIRYSSSSVDGQVASTNNQPSWLGQGHSIEAGFIERKYVSCADDMGSGANNTIKTGDLCWKSDNAILSLGSHSSELLWDSAQSKWKLLNDDGSRIEKLTGATNGARNGEHWRLTTTDGTQYFFGLNPPAYGTIRTDSVSTVPVFGNHDNEPCNATTFAASYCQQAWRWNLDRVVDTTGNLMTYRYVQEKNNYGRNSNTGVSTYDRASYLTNIEYGERTGADLGVPPARVIFGVSERCLPSGAITCAPEQLTAANASSWPDVPFDQICTSTTTCPDKTSPSFFTRKRLVTLYSQILSGSTATTVDSWSFGQTLPDPGDGTGKVLWLANITHKGLIGGAVTDPTVSFIGKSMSNRVDGFTGGAFPMNKWRISSLRTESGAQVSVTYSAAECSSTSKPASVAANTMRCFPIYWTREGGEAPTLHWFHKYLVTKVVEDDLVTDAPDKSTDYIYAGSPAWHYDDNEFTQAKYRTWGDWRGYNYVTVQTGISGAQTSTRYLFFRGMHGDRANADGSQTKSVSIRDTTGADYVDYERLNGYVREQITYNGAGGAEITGTINRPWFHQTGVGGGKAALLLGTESSRTRTRLSSGSYRIAEVGTEYDTYGMAVAVSDLGDVSRGDDDRCTRLTYVRNDDAWITDRASRQETVSVSCDGATSRPAQVVSDERTYFDQHPGVTTEPSAGLPSKTEVMTSWNNGPVYEQRSRAEHDALGRIVKTFDGLNRVVSTIAFTPEVGGPVTGMTTTDAAGNVSTSTLQPAWGLPTVKVDANNDRTDLAYDPSGRLTSVWLPDRSKADGKTASASFSYRLSNTAGQANLISSQELTHTAGYKSTHTLLDGFLRTRQVQTLGANNTGRLIKDTKYNARGGVAEEGGPFYDANSGPTTTLYDVAETELPAQTVYNVDGADRIVASIFKVKNAELWRTTTTYGGNWTAIDPPVGETPTVTVDDVRGNTIELRQYQAGSPGGAYDSTFYTYTPRDQLASVKNAGGSTWTYTYDLKGRQTSVDDPDKGTTTSDFDAADRLVSTKDARNQSLFYSYDNLDRKTSIRSGSATGPVLSSWVYDTLKKGLLTSSTRTINGNNYVSEATGYDALGRSTGTKLTVPPSEGKLAGQYATTTSYLPDGSLDVTRMPDVPGLPPESLRMIYDAAGNPTAMGGWHSYVVDAQYSSYGEPLQYTMGDIVNGKASFQSFTYQEGTRRLGTMQVKREGQTLVDDTFTYLYDQAGNVLSIGQSYNQGTGGDRQCFDYDYLRRLAQARTTSGASCATPPSTTTLGGTYPYWRNYEYWKSGNRAKVTDHAAAGDTTRTYAYPAGDAPRPHAVTGVTTSGPGGTAADSYTYDAAGNMATRTEAGDTDTLAWDAEGHLKSLDGPAGSTDFVYDAEGSRIIKHDKDGATLYIGGTEVRWTKSSDSVASTRYYQFNGATVAMRTAESAVENLMADRHGTATVSVDRFTGILSRRWLEPFGNLRGQYSNWESSARGFVDGQIDTSTGLTHLGAREYDPKLGKFISVDPIIDLTSPQQMNAYAYASSNPVTASDPDGLLEDIEKGGGQTAPDRRLDPPPTAEPPPPTNDNGNQDSVLDNAGDGIKDAKNWVHRKAASGLHKTSRYAATHPDPLNSYIRDEVEEWGDRWWSSCATAVTVNPAACKLATAEAASWFVGGPIGGAGAKVGTKALTAAATRKAELEAAEAAASRMSAKEVAAAACKVTPNSFLPGTVVLMADGSTKPIEDVETGQLVAAYDPETGKAEAKPVVATIIGDGLKDLVEVTVVIRSADGRERTGRIVATDGHRFYLPAWNEWSSAGDLRAGERLKVAYGDALVSVSHAHKYQAFKVVHNLTVGVLHNYYVVANGVPILVHNQNGNGIDLTNAVEWPKGDFPVGGAIDSGGPKGGIYYRQRGGAVTNYAVYDADGIILHRVDLTGTAHGDVPTPHVQDYVRNVAPNGKVYPKPSGIAVPAGPGDIPKGC